jgi:PAS domain S-box-containing protein
MVLRAGYLVLFGVTASLCYILAVTARDVVEGEAGKGLVATLLLSGGWATTTFVRLLSQNVTVDVWLRIVGLVVGLGSVGAWLYFASAYSGHAYHRHTGLRWGAVIGYVSIVLVKLTNPLHNLYFESAVATAPFRHLVFEPSGLYWVITGAAYTLVGIGLFWLFDSLRPSGLDTRQFGAVLSLTAAPAILDVVVYAEWAPTLFLEVSYAPLGMAVFAIGTLVVADGDIQPLPAYWRREILQELDNGIVVLDSEDRVQYVNDAAAAMFPVLRDAETEVFETAAPTLAEYSYRPGKVFDWKEDGSRKDYRVLETTLPSTRVGSVRAFVYLDVTELERYKDRLEHSKTNLRRFQQAVESAGHAVFITDLSGTIQYVNPAFEEITGYSRAEAVGNTPSILSSGEMADEFYEQLWETIEQGEVWEAELMNERKDGTVYEVHQTVAPIQGDHGDVQSYVAIQTDITERKSREQHLQVLSRVLRHNLRNDLTAVRLWAESIASDSTESPQEVAEKILKKTGKLLEQSEKEKKILDILLAPPERTQIDIGEFLGQLATEIEDEYESASLEVSAPAAVNVRAIHGVEIALNELVENAIEHNDSDSPEATVSVREEDDAVSVHIRDNGPEIPKMDRQILANGSITSELYHGTGLGLWGVYWSVRMSGGTVVVHDDAADGNHIEMVIPKADAVMSETNTDSPLKRPERKRIQ